MLRSHRVSAPYAGHCGTRSGAAFAAMHIGMFSSKKTAVQRFDESRMVGRTALSPLCVLAKARERATNVGLRVWLVTGVANANNGCIDARFSDKPGECRFVFIG
jgi:hypothetical protein